MPSPDDSLNKKRTAAQRAAGPQPRRAIALLEPDLSLIVRQRIQYPALLLNNLQFTLGTLQV
jgi:hypothetical protein